MGELRALTVRQPWAGAIMWFGKDVENRTRPMSYRGPLLIHAILYEPDWHDFLTVRDIAMQPVEWTDARRARGVLLGTVEVTGCHHAEDCGARDTRDGLRHLWRYCSPWRMPDQYHITLADPRPLPEAIPCRGALGLWRLTGDTEVAVRGQLAMLAGKTAGDA